MAVLQGFEEVNISAPVSNVTMTVMDSRIRFNKATAAALGYPAYVKVLVNERGKQVALAPSTGRDANAVKFSKPEAKQRASVNVSQRAVVDAGDYHEDEQVVFFDAKNAKPGTMKQRGRRAAAQPSDN